LKTNFLIFFEVDSVVVVDWEEDEDDWEVEEELEADVRANLELRVCKLDGL